MSNDINQTPQIIIPEKKSVFDFFLPFLQSKFFTISFGIFIGLGMGVKFNPETTFLRSEVKRLESENIKLKKDLTESIVYIQNAKMEIRNSVKLP